MAEGDTRFGACGDECSACPRYLATLAGDAQRLGELAALWHRLGWRDRVVAAEEMSCHGCTAEQSCVYDVAPCAGKRGLTNCGACADQAGCERLRTTLAHSDTLAGHCRTVCTEEEWRVLERAFFRKRENLEAARAK